VYDFSASPGAQLQAEFFVSPLGSDTAGNGSAAAPWATVERARNGVRDVTQGGTDVTGDVYVWLAEGTYTLAAPLAFDGADGVKNGAPFTIHYAVATPGARAALSGGAAVEGGWAPAGARAPPGAFVAALPPAAGAYSRQLFVDGARAPPCAVNVSGWAHAGANITADGYALPAAAGGTGLLALWAAQGGAPLEFVYTGVGSTWTESRCRAASVAADAAGGAVVTMQEPCWTNGRTRGDAFHSNQHITFPTALENVVAAAVAGAGCSATRISSHELVYAPLAGQDMAAATAVVPVLEVLVNVSGPVAGLSFEGLTFEHATWALPSTGVGYIENQAGQIYVGTPGAPNASAMASTPAAVDVALGRNVSFVGCTFQHTGASALAIGRFSQGSTVANCTFFDVSGAGLFLGDVDDPVEPPANQDSGHTVFNNRFAALPAEYHGCGALTTGWVSHTLIAHNEITDASDGSIESGWGWGGGYDKYYAAANRIVYNKIVNSNWLLEDCGSIYVNGFNAGSEISYNYCANQTRLYGALYPDEGSANWWVHDNVVDNAVEWLHIWTPSIVNITVERNFYGPQDFNTTHGTNCTYADNVWVPPGAAWPAAARDIMAAAGNVD